MHDVLPLLTKTKSYTCLLLVDMLTEHLQIHRILCIFSTLLS